MSPTFENGQVWAWGVVTELWHLITYAAGVLSVLLILIVPVFILIGIIAFTYNRGRRLLAKYRSIDTTAPPAPALTEAEDERV